MSHRDGVEHGVPSWIAGAHADPDQAAAFYSWDVDLWIADPDATAEKPAQLGGSVLMAPTDTPNGRRAVLADPQGAPFCVSRVLPA